MIGQTGISKCGLIHTFSNPCLSDHLRPNPNTLTNYMKTAAKPEIGAGGGGVWGEGESTEPLYK